MTMYLEHVLYTMNVGCSARARVSQNLWTMQVLKKRKRASLSGANFGLVRFARFCREFVVSGVAVGERRWARGVLVRGSQNLKLKSGITVASGTAKCTPFLGSIKMQVSCGAWYCVVIEVEVAVSGLCTVRVAMASLGDAHFMDCSVTKMASVDALRILQPGTSFIVTRL